MKKLAVLLGLLTFITLGFSQSTVYEVRMSQTMVGSTTQSTTTARGQDICENTLDKIQKCGYEQVGTILEVNKESKECKSFFSECTDEITTTCESLEESYDLKSKGFYQTLFCEIYKSKKEEQKKAEKQVTQTITGNIDTAMKKFRKYYRETEIPLSIYPATQMH